MHLSPRREFLERLGVAVTGLAASSAFAGVDRESMRLQTSPWDMSWVDRLKNAEYRVVFDANDIGDGLAPDLAGMFMDQFREVYGTHDEATRAVIVARQLGAPLAFGDSLWARYDVGVETHVNDPTTHAAARRNPYRPRLEGLLGRGATLLVCNIAAMNWAARLAQQVGRDVEATRTEVREGLIPGAILVPSGIFALIRAQNAGCAFIRGA